jgi:hypothetical protein
MKLSLPSQGRWQTGIMLVECMVYVALFAVISGLAFAAFYRAEKNSRNLRYNSEDILRVIKAGEVWRKDIRRATAPLQLVEAPEAQILHIPQGTNEVLYAFREGEMLRRPTPAALWTRLVPKVKGSRMQLDRRQHLSAWRWEVELKSEQKVARVKPLFTFQTVAPMEIKP